MERIVLNLSEGCASRIHGAAGCLSRLSVKERNDWRTIWMMLVGAWYLLREAKPHLESGPIDYDRAEAFAHELLKDPAGVRACRAPHPWPAGFYLLSAEHRIANSVDRLTAAFAGATCQRGENPYERCRRLLGDCLHCTGSHWLKGDDARRLLSRFEKTEGTWPCFLLARVYKRVNEIKHGTKGQTSIAAYSTHRRWQEATVALVRLTSLFGLLLDRRLACSRFQPLQR